MGKGPGLSAASKSWEKRSIGQGVEGQELRPQQAGLTQW